LFFFLLTLLFTRSISALFFFLLILVLQLVIRLVETKAHKQHQKHKTGSVNRLFSSTPSPQHSIIFSELNLESEKGLYSSDVLQAVPMHQPTRRSTLPTPKKKKKKKKKKKDKDEKDEKGDGDEKKHQHKSKKKGKKTLIKDESSKKKSKRASKKEKSERRESMMKLSHRMESIPSMIIPRKPVQESQPVEAPPGGVCLLAKAPPKVPPKPPKYGLAAPLPSPPSSPSPLRESGGADSKVVPPHMEPDSNHTSGKKNYSTRLSNLAELCRSSTPHNRELVEVTLRSGFSALVLSVRFTLLLCWFVWLVGWLWANGRDGSRSSWKGSASPNTRTISSKSK